MAKEGPSILLDTNIVIEVLSNRRSVSDLNPKETSSISTITILELYALAGIGSTEEELIEHTLKDLDVLPVTQEIAKIAGKLARTRPNQYHRADLLIAATAIEYQIPLLTKTKNTRDFARIKNLQIVTLNV